MSTQIPKAREKCFPEDQRGGALLALVFITKFFSLKLFSVSLLIITSDLALQFDHICFLFVYYVSDAINKLKINKTNCVKIPKQILFQANQQHANKSVLNSKLCSCNIKKVFLPLRLEKLSGSQRR